ncbi:MAG TPA: proline--tRNA ligase [Peptococcaceae bacterium]|jgi:prolyl-tRNA synthetase|nr:proline--tRNA ligase [Clostridia bacterium]HOB81346.1 proline--tRNA ligase [Peptococcaceae bacterium]HPZ70622.1 proline--tRNA ligase [Peptococcaceae bacterium]HQD53432.1 proline--tRNA ligase [Peptococcaceae bacterium]
MYFSNLLAPTLREIPAEAEVVSHQLLLRAGFIRKSSSGIYTYLPLGMRVIQKIEAIVREEMNKAGGQEILMPIVQAAELWRESGRWDVYGKELFRLRDRHDREFCLGPTHEEVVTDIARTNVYSYRQLPLMLYQIQNKYRDERRPRFGLMRGREFIMKDLYSFDRDEAGLDVSYQKMYEAYTTVFKRCGLDFRPVEADSGAIGGNVTHEFMVIAESGEAEIVYCSSCDYAANVEIAPGLPTENPPESPQEMAKVATPDQTTIAQVTEFLKLPPQKFIKTLFYQADDELIVALVRGDRNLNEIKLQKLHRALNLELASAEKVKELTGSQPGYVGPVGLKKVKIYADEEIRTMVNAVCGANEEGYHLINVQPEKDFQVFAYGDLRFIEAGEPCPRCRAALQSARGIEVGQVFKLGTKYSQALEAKYVDENGKENLMVMGCYGIGVSRTMAAAVEQNHDEHGIIWPLSIAPYHVVIVPVAVEDEVLWEESVKIYQELQKRKIEVVLDDRDERPGVKFKDADLIGYPIRVTVGKKFKEEGKVELKLRHEKDIRFLDDAELCNFVEQLVTTRCEGDWRHVCYRHYSSV